MAFPLLTLTPNTPSTKRLRRLRSSQIVNELITWVCAKVGRYTCPPEASLLATYLGNMTRLYEFHIGIWLL